MSKCLICNLNFRSICHNTLKTWSTISEKENLNEFFRTNPSRPNPGQRKQNQLNFYFHTSLSPQKVL